jgi:hypothetical protein
VWFATQDFGDFRFFQTKFVFSQQKKAYKQSQKRFLLHVRTLPVGVGS